MGQTLSTPITGKESMYCQNDLFRVGSSCMQGWRITMEDAHTQILSLPEDPGTAFFAVYDGHGGSIVAKYAGEHLHKFILKRPEYQEDIERALQLAFLDIDHNMRFTEMLNATMVGSTAVVVIIKENQLLCANAGDSRAIACVKGEVEVLSEDHKPNNHTEMRRIVDAGGFIEFNRVNGNLALSRALGDFMFKQNANKEPHEQIVTAFPDVEKRVINEDWDFIILACDGIWDVMTNAAVINFCRERIAKGMYPDEICEEIMDHCLAPGDSLTGLGADNMTVVIVCLLHNKPYSALVERCARYTKINAKPSKDDTSSSEEAQSNAADESEE